MALITGLTNSVRLFESPEYIIDKNIFLKVFIFKISNFLLYFEIFGNKRNI